MGQCCSCRKSSARLRDTSTKICGHIQSAVSPLHLTNEDSSTCLNGYPQIGANVTTAKKTPRPATPRRPRMSNTFTNMNITNSIKGIVSKRRNRYKKDGFNLDLTYITDNVIAMGYPASSLEGVYRNHIDEVARFLEVKHRDHYFIYNLCSERSYDTSKFRGRVRNFPFDDHNPPRLDLIRPFCQDVHEWLCKDSRNVAVVHCKAGKGRTGTMICCYLLHSGQFLSAEEALSFYGNKRTQDRKGVTIPSQMRYVNYYSTLVRNQWLYRPRSLYILQIILEPIPCFAGGQGCLSFSISQQKGAAGDNDFGQQCLKRYKSGLHDVRRGKEETFAITFDVCLPLIGDVKLEFFNKPKIGRKERIFQFWFNTAFVHEEVVLDGEKALRLSLGKHELDIVNKKDKQHKVFSSDFKVTLLMHEVPSSKSGTASWLSVVPTMGSTGLPQDNTPSESSEADTSEDDYQDEDEWDSGESTYL